MTKLIIVRHCQAQGNLERFFQGRIDSDITPKGRAQIGAVTELLSSEPIDVFYTSSLKRARLTTDGINVYHNVPIITDDRLAEIDAGDWEGRFLTDIEQLYPQAYSDWCHNPAVFQAPGGESIAQVYQRVGAAVDDIIRDNDGKTVCIVSHGCAIKCLMCYLHGWKVDDIANVPLGTNTSVNILQTDGRQAPVFLMENYTDHLALIV